MIKFFVRTTGERKLDSSYEQIIYEKLIDTEHRPVMSFIEQLEYISEYDAVLLEDDCRLCKDFYKEITLVISEFPNRIINFFTNPRGYFITREAQTFYFNQCTYYPKGISKVLAQKMREIENQEPNKYQYDVLESMALKNMGIEHIQYRPCLVQHLDFKSLIGNRDNYRITPYFIDYLKELNLKYEDANNLKSKIRLTNMLLKDFKEKIKRVDNK